MSGAAKTFDFTQMGLRIKAAREAAGITRKMLAKELHVTTRHLQAVENDGQYPSFELLIQLVTKFHISVDSYIYPEQPCKKTSTRRQIDALLDSFTEEDLSIIEGTANAICKARERME